MLMPWLGKLIGALLGYKIAGIFGLIFGLALGHFIDLIRRFRLHLGAVSGFGAQKSFTANFFTIMGYVAGNDAPESVQSALRHMMDLLRLTEAQRVVALTEFEQGTASDFKIDVQLQQFNLTRINPFFRQIFVDMQAQAAQLSGAMDAAKQQRLNYIFKQLGYTPLSFHFQDYGAHFQQSGFQSRQANPNQLTKAYFTLGIKPEVTDAEVKRAYRQLMNKHHPDKLAAQGLSEAILKMATEKAQEIQLAYDCIKRQRHL